MSAGPPRAHRGPRGGRLRSSRGRNDFSSRDENATDGAFRFRRRGQSAKQRSGVARDGCRASTLPYSSASRAIAR
jgi:hypothetical protein